MFKGKLILAGLNAKTIKGDGAVFETAIMYLAPSNLATRTTLCPMAELAACKTGCLNTAGRGAMHSIARVRARKSQWYENGRDDFMDALVADIIKFERYCARKDVKACIRLNGTSDIPFERIKVLAPHAKPSSQFHFSYKLYDSIMTAFPAVQFYDYTKTVPRMYRQRPDNYHLTLSYSGANDHYTALVTKASKDNHNVAVVFRNAATAARYIKSGFLGRPVIDGDKNDLRFTDPDNCIVALYAKGRAKRDTSGFVID